MSIPIDEKNIAPKVTKEEEDKKNKNKYIGERVVRKRCVP